MENEKRLIDAKEAEQWAREHILDAIERYTIINFLKECSTVDAVEVVRCKNCEYSRALTRSEKKTYVDECVVCLNASASNGYNVVWEDGFCAEGERRCE